jgi:hypothetical protein
MHLNRHPLSIAALAVLFVRPLNVLAPSMPTIKTLRLMNTEHLTALRTSPFFFLASDEMAHAEFSNVLKIVDHAHAILGSVPFIQMVQPDAREAVTIEAILDISVHYLLTVLDSTSNAGFRFDAVVASAAGAWFLISYACNAEAAIHSARSD